MHHIPTTFCCSVIFHLKKQKIVLDIHAIRTGGREVVHCAESSNGHIALILEEPPTFRVHHQPKRRGYYLVHAHPYVHNYRIQQCPKRPLPAPY